MKNRIQLGAAAAALMFAGLAAADSKITMVCDIRGGQAVPGNASEGFGVGRFVIDTDANTVEYRICFTKMLAAETVAHIHGAADIGSTAGVKHNLGVGNPKVGVWNYSESDESDILAGKMYVNIHSEANPGGELRGQIVNMVSPIDGFQEVPMSGSDNTAWGAYMIDTDANTLTYHIQIDDGFVGTETAAHIHGAAMHGVNAGVLFNLGTGSPKVGVWNYPEEAEADILAGRTYVNIHTQAFPGGEIRGQITRFVAALDAAQETPPVNDPEAAGVATMAINTDTNELSYHLRFDNLSGNQTLAHIHGMAPEGASAGVLHNVGVGEPRIGTWTYTEGQEADLNAGLTYFNIHSQSFPGGNIRGQIYPVIDKAPPAPCLGDVNMNGVVDAADLAGLLAEWGPQKDSPADFDGDGQVGPADLAALLSAWGPCP